jgi:hypothetical protein
MVATAVATAHLTIHSAGRAGSGPGFMAMLRQRLRAPLHAWRRRQAPARIGVQIDDLQGRPFFRSAEPWPLIDVPLPAGTYHVTVDLGELRRRYTVTLEPGAALDLYPQLQPHRV